MPVWPKTLYTFRASLRTVWMAGHLKRSTHADAEQTATLPGLLRRLASTQIWREAGIEAEMSYDTFRSRIRPHTYEQLEPAVLRMIAGEADVLWPGTCSFFATTAGTSSGVPKYIPVAEEMLAHCQTAAFDALLYYTARVGHAGVFSGRHLFLGGSTALAPLPNTTPQAYAGNLSGIALLNLPPWAEKHLYEPGADVAQMADWDAKLDAIATRVSAQDVSLLAGLPPWALAFADTVRQRFSGGGDTLAHLQELWPNLECYIHGGVPLAPYQTELRAALGPDVKFHEVYATAEAFVAAQDADAAAGLRLLSNHGVFFEFVALADIDATGMEKAAQKAVPVGGVKTGVDYAVLVTTPSGFARYLLGDVVRFTSVHPPRLVHLGQTKLELSAFGEHVTEKEITDALVALCKRQEWKLVNFHVAPLFATTLTGQNRGRHEWWIELKPGTTITPIGPQMATELDAELQRLNSHYAAKRRAGGVDAPFVRLVMPGVFEHWMRFHHKWGGQNKLPRLRSDRSIADELAQITNFAPH